jgi:hypothetical protein
MKDFQNEICGNCEHYTGEECDGNLNEGMEKFYDS